MGGDDIVIDVLETALRRFPFMDCLGDEPKDKRTLVAELDCSRSTVNRGIRELEALDLVAYVDGGYRLTSLGELVATDFADLAETVELRLQFRPFLKWMPDDEFDLELELLRDADLLLPTESDPYAMVNYHVLRLKEADRYRMLLPLTGLHAHRVAHQNITNEGARGELVVTPPVAETFQSDPAYAPLTEDMVGTGRLRIYVYPGEIPYFVGILDGTVQIGVDEDKEPRAIAETDDDGAREWAEAVYDEYREAAEPLEMSRASPRIQP